MRRRANARRRKIGKEFKTIPVAGNSVRGNGEDSGKYFRCGNCGFICDSTRDKRARTINSVEIVEFTPNSYPIPGDASAVLGGIDKLFVSNKLTADGSIAQPYMNYMPQVNGGCPMCGTQNYDGSQGD